MVNMEQQQQQQEQEQQQQKGSDNSNKDKTPQDKDDKNGKYSTTTYYYRRHRFISPDNKANRFISQKCYCSGFYKVCNSGYYAPNIDYKPYFTQ